MELTKKDGKVREQIETETIARLRFAKKWGDIVGKECNNFYSHADINDKLKNEKDVSPFKYNGEGFGFFTTKQMHDAVLGTCRCGRKKSNGHIVRCLRRAKNKYLHDSSDEEDGGKTDDIGANGVGNNSVVRTNDKGKFVEKMPQTSLGVYGWPRNRNAVLEHSIRYVSPKCTMPGPRIDDKPYSNIFIG